MVDGFYGASCLKDEHPEDYEFLTTFDVEAEYIEENHHHSYSAPIIQVDRKTQDLKQIRYFLYGIVDLDLKLSQPFFYCFLKIYFMIMFSYLISN